MDYLPKDATIEQACAWLHVQTGETWVLSRLLESGLVPHFWLDFKPGFPLIFGDRIEGFQTRMVFAGDIQRLEADGTNALVNMFTAHDGRICKAEPGWPVPLSELRFKREAVQAVAADLCRARAVAPVAGTGKRWTPEVLDELKAYRDTHTMQETAQHFNVSEQRIRKLLPSKKPKPTPFSGLIHRAK